MIPALGQASNLDFVTALGLEVSGKGTLAVDEATLATAEHQGAYDQVRASFGALREWIADNGYEIAGPPEEAYLSKIEDAPPQELLTEVRFPVTKE